MGGQGWVIFDPVKKSPKVQRDVERAADESGCRTCRPIV